MMPKQNKTYLRYSWFLVGMVFLVILAGGVVRMTQSGMGCPDWPKCFGLWIPPTDSSQLPSDFEKYLEKQDIDHSFNVYHTWIEYINRLLGALLGVFIFIYTIWTSLRYSDDKRKMKYALWSVVGMLMLTIGSFILDIGILKYMGIVGFLAGTVYAIYMAFRTSNRRDIMTLAFLLLVAVGIQGWLGKVVVDANLSVVKITIHMIGALVIAALPIWIITRLEESVRVSSKVYRNVLSGMIMMVLLQIVLGTQVREEIDVISKALSYEKRELWIAALGVIFYVHRSFSWLILIGSGVLYWLSFKQGENRRSALISVLLVVCAILLGVIMAHFDMPALAQPLHLLIACILVMQLFYSRMLLGNKRF